MAKILFTAIVSDMRNKLNGSVFSKNRYGSYVRNKVTPVNPQTSYQQAQRQQLGALSSGWRDLSQAQRDAWIAAAPNFPTTDIFGNTKILSGNALYVALNKNLINAGESQITDAPAAASIPTFAVNTVNADSVGGTLTIDVSETSLPSGYDLMVYATPNTGAGISYVKNKLRFIGTGTVTSGSADIYTAWNTRFGTLTAGDKITVKVALVNQTTGQAGTPSQATGTIS